MSICDEIRKQKRNKKVTKKEREKETKLREGG
jgi:hypothetical protein